MKNSVVLGIIASICLVVSCQSKFEEAKPQGLSTDSGTKSEYILKSESIQKRFSDAQALVASLDQFMAKMQIPGSKTGSASDIILAILDSVKTKRSATKAKNYESYGQVYLTLPGISDECRVIDVKSSYFESTEKVKHDIQVSTCKTGGEYKSLLEISISQDARISLIVEENASSILPDMKVNLVPSLEGCIVLKDSEENITNIDCEASDWIVNDREKVRFTQLSYDAADEIRYRAQGILSQDGVPKVKLILQLNSLGKFYSKATAISQ